MRTFISVLSDYTFLNERLAKHYGIPNVYGPLPPCDARPRKQARRAAAAGQRAVGHVLCDAYIAGASRRTGAAQHPAAAVPR